MKRLTGLRLWDFGALQSQIRHKYSMSIHEKEEVILSRFIYGRDILPQRAESSTHSMFLKIYTPQLRVG